MKLLFEHIELGVSESVRIKRYCIQSLNVPYHHHPEIEIVLIVKGSGKVFVRSSLSQFQPGDLFIFGPNTPHTFASDEMHSADKQQIELVVIQLHPNFEKHILVLPEFNHIEYIFKLSNAGLKIQNIGETNFGMQINRLSSHQGFKRLMLLISFLNEIQRKFKFSFIDRFAYDGSDHVTPERLQKIKKFLSQNFNKDISLEQVAAIANMNKVAFCRYFKEHTRRTFTQYLNEVRVDHASKLLIEGSLPVSTICYEVGYNNLPYFIKQFKKIRGVTPKQYRILNK